MQYRPKTQQNISNMFTHSSHLITTKRNGPFNFFQNIFMFKRLIIPLQVQESCANKFKNQFTIHRFDFIIYLNFWISNSFLLFFYSSCSIASFLASFFAITNQNNNIWFLIISICINIGVSKLSFLSWFLSLPWTEIMPDTLKSLIFLWENANRFDSVHVLG